MVSNLGAGNHFLKKGTYKQTAAYIVFLSEVNQGQKEIL
jgi:hypothetical protein